MLKRRSSVRNCCRIESSNWLNSIFIKFNFFIFLNIFVRGGPGPWGPPPRSATDSVPVINSVRNRISSLLVLLPILRFQSRFNWSKSPLFTLLVFFFRLSPSIHLSASIQYHLFSSSSRLHRLYFLSKTILSRPSESPSEGTCAQPISFFFFVVCMH